MWSKAVLPGAWRGGAVPLVVGFALLALSIVATSWFIARLASGNASIRQTLAVESRLADVLSLLQDAETGQRGYLLSGEESYLEPYRHALTALEHDFGALATAIAASGPQHEALRGLQRIAGDKLTELRTTIERYRQGRPAEALALVRAGTGKALMDRARATIARMKALEERLAVQRQAELERDGQWLRTGVVSAILLMLGLGVLAVRETERRASLARFLPAEMVPHLAAGLRQGRRQKAAIAFVDLRDSTTLAEGMDPQRLSIFFAAFRRRVTAAARAHGGVVDKFIGDGALLLFGVPDERADDPSRALACARHLLDLVARWNDKRGFTPPLRIGIGVHFGEVFCGVIGDGGRLEFTVLGDAVNVAARLEQATKRLGEPILASQAILDAAGEHAGWHEVSRAPLPGRAEAMCVFGMKNNN